MLSFLCCSTWALSPLDATRPSPPKECLPTGNVGAGLLFAEFPVEASQPENLADLLLATPGKDSNKRDTRSQEDL